MKLFRSILLAIAVICAFSVNAEQQYDLYDYPGAIDTMFVGSSENGSIVGIYYKEPAYLATKGYSFVKNGNTVTEVNVPGSEATYVKDISNSGTIVGWYVQGGSHGFILKNGVYTTFDVPGAVSTFVDGINSKGELVGSYTDAQGQQHGFTSKNGQISEFTIENAVIVAVGDSSDNGLVAGHYFLNDNGNWSTHAFVKDGELITEIVDPTVTGSYRDVGGVNNAGLVVGSYITGAPDFHQYGYVYNYGTNTVNTVDIYAYGILLTDIDNNNRVVGLYMTPNGRMHGLTFNLQ